MNATGTALPEKRSELEQQATDRCAGDPSLVLIYRKAHLKVAEIFDGTDMFNRKGADAVDIVRYRFRARPVPGSLCAECYTLWLNLENDPKYLLANMSRATRWQIRRAERERLCYEFTSTPTRSWIVQFFDFYELFVKSKKLKWSVDRRRFLAILSQNALDLSRVSSPEGRVLVWHAHLRSGRYVSLDSSASLFRREVRSMAAYIGRANRLHHWLDVLRFRDEGFAIYDFGGWYAGRQNEELLRINRFKESFGGKVVFHYKCDQGLTRKGALALWLMRSFLQNLF
jgi:hypothetical protein